MQNPTISLEREAARFARWWLDRFTDDKLAGFALGLGVEGACVEKSADPYPVCTTVIALDLLVVAGDVWTVTG